MLLLLPGWLAAAAGAAAAEQLGVVQGEVVARVHQLGDGVGADGQAGGVDLEHEQALVGHAGQPGHQQRDHAAQRQGEGQRHADEPSDVAHPGGVCEGEWWSASQALPRPTYVSV